MHEFKFLLNFASRFLRLHSKSIVTYNLFLIQNTSISKEFSPILERFEPNLGCLEVYMFSDISCWNMRNSWEIFCYFLTEFLFSEQMFADIYQVARWSLNIH